MAGDINDNLLLWLDLETTGSDESHDCIVEVGCILTFTNLEPVGDECEFTHIVRPTAEGLGRLIQNPIVRQMHEDNGLLKELLDGAGDPPHVVAGLLLGWLADNGAKSGHTVIAGSGVGHFDRRFVKRWLPEIDRFLRYWPLDMSSIRRAHAMWVGTPVSAANDAKTHRALDDIRCHLAEARAFRDLWRERLA